jgi:CDP-diacylglycerol--serine O-phosphatidyltransferase
MTDPRPHLSMLRSYTPADALTIANASCGTIALFLCLNYVETGSSRYIWIAFLLLPMALVFDILDGWVARAQPNRKSVLGGDLDSLADVISFGVAPAVIAYGCGMQGLYDRIVLGYFVACGVSRLARFNVTAETLSGGTGKVKFFEGTPIPSSIILVFVLAAAAWSGAIGESLWWGALTLGGFTLHPLVLLFAVSGSLMISRIRIPKL